MKKLLLIVLEVIVIFLVELSLLFIMTKSVYYDIIDDYTIFKKNIKDVKLLQNGKSVIDDYILQVQYDDRYIFLKTIEKNKIAKLNKKDIKEYINGNYSVLNDVEKQFYIIDTSNGDVSGPYNIDEFTSLYKETDVNYEKLVKWECIYYYL